MPSIPSRQRRRSWLATGVLLVCSFITAEAHQSGQITGVVQDQTGEAVANVPVTLRGSDTRVTTTDATGRFNFDNLPPADYEVSAASRGFDTARRTVRLQPAATLSILLTLRVTIQEEVMVTAARTGAADGDVLPIAVSSLADDALARLPMRTVEDVAPALPSGTFTQNTTFGQLSIRGVGATTVTAGGDPSSAMYVDGVYLARPAMAFVDFLDLERVEVLRGPQGTLYGRNTVGGAMQLVSKTPTDDVDAATRITGGNLGLMRADARISGPLRRGRVMGSVAFARGVRDGYVRDLEQPDDRLGADNVTAARGQLRVVINPRHEMLFSSDMSDQRGTPLTYNKVLEVKPGFTVDNPSSLHDVRTSTPASGRVRQSGGSVRLTSALTPATTLVSLTAFRRLDNEYLVDADITELNLFSALVDERQHQWSEEVTIVDRRRRLTTVVGLFWFTERLHQHIEADQPQAGLRSMLDPRVDAGSAAVFGQTRIALTPMLAASIGIRYSRERKTIDNAGGRYTLGEVRPLPGSEYAYTDSILHSAWTPRFGVEMQLGRQLTAYVSAAKGFKSGGFNASATQPTGGFAPEWAWSYEGGVKTRLLNGRARLNVTVFDMDYSSLQVQTPVGLGVFDIRNAAAATITGVELEGASRLGRGFEAGGHMTWLDAAYDRYIAVAMGGIVGDVSGNRLNNAPEWAGRVWVEWAGTLAGAQHLALTVDATAQSTVYYTPFNDAIQRQLPYGLLGARVEYGPSHRRWSVNTYAKNLTGTDYVMAAFATSPAAYGGRPGRSREIGVQLILQK